MHKTTFQDETIKSFHRLVEKEFQFLIEDYGYQRLDDVYDQKTHYRDKTYIIRYKSKQMMVEVSWYFAASIIDVVFVEPIGDRFEGKRSVFPNEDNDVHRMVDIYTLGHYLKNSEGFLLQDTHISTLEAIRKRYQVIDQTLEKVVQNLARYTKENASSIVQGDTSLFNTLMLAYQQLIQEQYPIGIF